MTITNIFKATLVVLLTLLGAVIIVNGARIILVLVIGIIIASAVRPIITRMTRWRIPEGIAIVSVYLVLGVVIIGISIAVIPPVVNQLVTYLENDNMLSYRIITAQRLVEDLISDVAQDEVSLVAPEQIREAVADFVVQVRRVMPNMLNDIGGSLGDAVLIFVFGAYWLTSANKATLFMTQITPPDYREKVLHVINEVETTMGSYVRGVVTVASIVAVLNFAVLTVLNVPNAFTIAFIIGVTTIIPMIGGLIGGIGATFITLVSAPQYVPIVFITFVVIQQIESYVLSPRIMGDSVGMDPLLIILYTSVGFLLYGIVGALIAVPIMGTLHILFFRFIIEPYHEEIGEDKAKTEALLAGTLPDADDTALQGS